MRLVRQLGPILAALRCHKFAVTMLILEVALTTAVLGNTTFVIFTHAQRAQVPVGVAEDRIGVIQSIGVVGMDNPGTVAGDIAALRNVPGVEAAAYGSPPLWNNDVVQIFTDASRQQVAAKAYQFLGSQGLSEVLGARVTEGRDFTDADLIDAAKVDGSLLLPALITDSLAKKLYPSGSALGKVLYSDNLGFRVIGVMQHLRGSITGRVDDDYSILSEVHIGAQNLGGGFVIRGRNGAEFPTTLRNAAQTMQSLNPGHVLQQVLTMDELRDNYFRADYSANRMLLAIVVVLLVATGCGVSSLANFWVQQRKRQIGLRRALGATRFDIMAYFQLENLLIVGAGSAVGVVLAYVLNSSLMERFEIARLPPAYPLLVAVGIWGLGQLAVLGPSIRATMVPVRDAMSR
jgi:putative ABC transport system permease protein